MSIEPNLSALREQGSITYNSQCSERPPLLQNPIPFLQVCNPKPQTQCFLPVTMQKGGAMGEGQRAGIKVFKA